MNFDLNNLFSEEISDETLYQLVNFFAELQLELESKFFAQLRRHVGTQAQPNCLVNDDINNKE